ncbi:MAG: TIGR01458 family HAD-type hydrolase [Candidatus Helarchaeota archaeon]
MVILKAFLIDLDGTLYTGGNPIMGARETIKFLNEKGYQCRFVSNTTRKSRKSIVTKLEKLGFEISEDHIFTPMMAAINFISSRKVRKCYFLTTGDVHVDYEQAGLEHVEDDAEFVVVGDAGDNFTYYNMNTAFQLILNGAKIIGLEKDKYWMSSGGLVLSAGPFVTALEFATGKQAEIMGKPTKSFFELALKDIGTNPEETGMIGDDIFTDIGGAQAQGLKGILVKTGKFREQVLIESGIEPDFIIDSIASLREIL